MNANPPPPPPPLPRRPFPLNEEIRDLICTFITEPFSTAALVSLCAVSKEWADSARRVLYHTPLERMPTFIDWPHANALLVALEGNSAVAQCVRSLEDIGVQLYDLPEPRVIARADRSAYRLRGQSEAWSWALAVIKCCLRLQRVGVAMDTTFQATTVAKTLKSTPLRRLILAASPKEYPLPLSRIDGFFKRSEITSLESLTLVQIVDDLPPNPSPLPRLPVQLRRLVLFLPLFPYRTILHLIPSPPHLSHLTDLLIESDHCPTSSDLLLLSRTVGPHLKRLEIVLLDVPISRQGIDSYALSHAGTHLPLELFSLFPRIEELNLFRFTGMSLARLAALECSSPLLRSFALCETAWEADGGEGEERRVPERVFPQEEVARVLKEGFGELDKCHLGWLPVENGDGVGEVDRVVEERGIELGWEGCLEACEECGGYHFGV